MPHLIIEHSANLAERVDVDRLVDALHDAALATGTASIDALRTRAVAREHYAVGDRHPDNAFVAVTARLGAGRGEAEQQRFVEALMDALDHALGAARETAMLSVEYQEIEPSHRLNRNHLRPLIMQRTSGGQTRSDPTETNQED